MAYAEKGVGAIFLRRNVFDPLMLSGDTIPRLHHPQGFIPLPARNRLTDISDGIHLLRGLSNEFARYEGWVQSHEKWGSEYREQRVNERIHGRGDGAGPVAYVPAGKMAVAWGLLARVM